MRAIPAAEPPHEVMERQSPTRPRMAMAFWPGQLKGFRSGLILASVVIAVVRHNRGRLTC